MQNLGAHLCLKKRVLHCLSEVHVSRPGEKGKATRQEKRLFRVLSLIQEHSKQKSIPSKD